MSNFYKEIQEGMKIFGLNIGFIINTILLAVVYILGVGITSLIAKISGKHFLDMKLNKDKSYWGDLNLKKEPIKNYYRQF